MNTFIRAALAATTLLFATPAFAQEHMDGMNHAIVGDLELSAAFTRAMPPAAPAGGGFLVIENHGDTDDRLIAASSPNADLVEIHEMVIENDVMKMGEVEGGLVIPAFETVTLAPGGYHLMFMQVTEPFVEGEMVPVTLTFEVAGEVEIMLPVAPIGATEMPMGHSHG